MSGFNKNQQYAYEVEATRPNQVAGYPCIAQPTFASPYTDAPLRLPHESSTADMPYIPSSTYESRAIVEHQPESSFIDARSRHPVSLSSTETEITELVKPTQGTAGSTISLHLRANYDLDRSQHKFSLMFGNMKRPAELQKVEYEDDWYNYALNVEVPPFPLTNAWNPTMMLKLQIEDKYGGLQSQVDAGEFTFTDMSPNLAYQSSPDFSRKRKYSAEYGDTQDYSESNPAKRSSNLRFQAKPRSMSGAYSAAQASPLPLQSSSTNPYSTYDLSKPPTYSSQLSHKGLYAVPSGLSLSQTDYKLPQMSPSLHSYSPYGSVAQPVRSPASILANPSGSGVSLSSVLPAPVLVRATTIPQQGGTSTAQPFNPYTMYQTKAILKIDGDLDKMSEDWSTEELDVKRRLVEFKRSQHGSTITTSFAPITPEARAARSICVSCIWWEEKDECFITSVDTIYLLEQLVNVRFTVEEKNRIRRNLEGFRPLTVSKAKQDSEEFFKLIMGFPNPKPRNIEKDVKVFPWKILAHALKKIISKYSASYSSTAGIGSLPITSTSSMGSTALSHATGGGHRHSSPQSVGVSTASSAYASHLSSSNLSPHLRVSAGLEVSAGHGLPLSQRPPSGHGMTQWGTTAHQMQYQSSLPPPGKAPWDYTYLNPVPATDVQTTAQTLHRSDLAADLSQISADNTYNTYGERTTRV